MSFVIYLVLMDLMRLNKSIVKTVTCYIKTPIILSSCFILQWMKINGITVCSCVRPSVCADSCPINLLVHRCFIMLRTLMIKIRHRSLKSMSVLYGFLTCLRVQLVNYVCVYLSITYLAHLTSLYHVSRTFMIPMQHWLLT